MTLRNRDPWGWDRNDPVPSSAPPRWLSWLVTLAVAGLLAFGIWMAGGG